MEMGKIYIPFELNDDDVLLYLNSGADHDIISEIYSSC